MINLDTSKCVTWLEAVSFDYGGAEECFAFRIRHELVLVCVNT